MLDSIKMNELGDIIAARPNLGEMVPVSIYRAMQYSLRYVLAEEFDKTFADKILFKAGKISGESFCREFLDTKLEVHDFLTDFKRVLVEQKIGILRVEKLDLDNQELMMTIAEDLDCSGLPFVDETVCNFDEGFLAGVLKVYTGKDFNVKEVDCWGTGDRVCRFLINNPQ